MSLAVATGIIGIVGKAIDRIFPDATEAENLKQKITSQILTFQQSEIEAASKIIVAEASGESWLQQSWRPITMLFFTGLVGAHWLGFTPDNLSESEVVGLLDIVQVGLGGYVLGRSGEKIMKEYKK